MLRRLKFRPWLVAQGGKQTKSIIMPGNKQAIVVYRADGEVYCSDASSTAYQFPLSNAKVIRTGMLVQTHTFGHVPAFPGIGSM